jgi:hypothetical protein
MRNQDLRLARHSVESNVDLTVSLLRRVVDDGDLDEPSRDEATRLLQSLEPLVGNDEIDPEDRHDVVSQAYDGLIALDDAVNGPLPSET